MNRVDLAVIRYEIQQKPKVNCWEDKEHEYKYKLRMCNTCPHRLTPRNCDINEYFELRLLIERAAKTHPNRPHICHELDGCFCAGHFLEMRNI